MTLVWGRECKLGWGYNQSLDWLIPIKGKPSATSKIKNKWWCYAYTTYLSSTDIHHSIWTSISLFLEPSFKKYLDFQIIFDDNQYQEVKHYFYRRREESKKFSKYPPDCSHFIEKIDYGVGLCIQFPKIGFPSVWEGISSLVNKRNFNETQKKAKCRVMINCDEVREMTVGELAEFMKEVEEGGHSRYDTPIRFYDRELAQRFRYINIDNQYEFNNFLTCLYSVYRKIEMQMEKNGYSGILPDLDSEEKSFDSIHVNLDKAKENYKSMDRNSILEMYPVLKKLFFSYVDYIKYSMSHENEINEGKDLPGTDAEMKPWLQELNTWTPSKISGEEINYTSCLIIIPSGNGEISEILRKTTKLSNVEVIRSKEITEPYIWETNNGKNLFGFVDMEGAEKSQVSDVKMLFESACPKGCTQDLKKWICTKCGEFVQNKLDPAGKQLMLCSCGEKRYEDKLLTCYHSNPQLEKSKETQRLTLNDKDLVRKICQRLQKIKSRKEWNTSAKILIAIDRLSSNESEEEIKSVLEGLKDVSVGKHTQQLINLYLGKR